MPIETKLAEIAEKSAVAAWCPLTAHPGLVALGVKVSSSESNSEDTATCGGSFELYSVAVTGADPVLEGRIETSSPVASIAWSSYSGSTPSSHPLGLIAGGLADGSVVLLCAAALRESRSGNVVVHTVPPSTSPPPGEIKVLAFSPIDTHMLCTGSTTGHLALYDCTDPTKPVASTPGPPTNPSDTNANSLEITAASWNPAVAHILATAQTDGSVTVWDTAAHTVWCDWRAATGSVSTVVWNPGQGLHLLTASSSSGQADSNVLHVWDLGASTSVPTATLTVPSDTSTTTTAAATTGVLDVAWCPHDDALLVSVGRDGTTWLWDLTTLSVVGQVVTTKSSPEAAAAAVPTEAGALFASVRPGRATTTQSRYRVQWSPFQRGVLLLTTMTSSGTDSQSSSSSSNTSSIGVQLHSLLALATQQGRPPAWLRPQSAVTTAFGGMLLSCESSPDRSRVVTIRTVSETSPLTKASQALETELAYYQQSTDGIQEFCRLQQESATTPTDQAIWGFMQISFSAQSRQALLLHLGFDAEEIAAKAAAAENTTTEERVDDDVDTAPPPPPPPTAASNGASSGASTNLSMSPEAQDDVKQALLVGNFEAAVACCLRHDNYGDALLLASCGGGADLWASTQERYLAHQAQHRPYLSLVAGIARQQLDELVATSDTSTWQETLAVLSTYAPSEDFPTLCTQLGDRLRDAGDESNASLCFMCALHLERAVEFWQNQLRETSSSGETSDATSDLLALHEFIIKVSIFVQAAGPSAALTPELEGLYSQYATALAEQGLLVTAAKYCRGYGPSTMILKDRLYRSRASQACYAALGSPPDFPYTMADVQESRGLEIAHPVVEPAAEQQQQPATSAYGQQQQQQPAQTASPYGAQAAAPVDQLPPDWMAIQDPSSGNTYYANQATGETTWEKPIAAAPVAAAQPPAYAHPAAAKTPLESSQRSYHPMQQQQQQPMQQMQQQPVQQQHQPVQQHPQQPQPTSSKPKSALVSKYGDGFVSSASNPALAYQYGNVGTSNPYGGTARPGTAAAVLQQSQEQAPVSGSLNFDSLQLSNQHSSIKDTLLGVSQALGGCPLNPVEKRQLAEAEKGVAILVKKLAMGSLNADIVAQVSELVNAVSNRNIGAALATQTALANSEWKAHKDWLKGIKVLLQLASKKF